jgi:hypothetical protein
VHEAELCVFKITQRGEFKWLRGGFRERPGGTHDPHSATHPYSRGEQCERRNDKRGSNLSVFLFV